MGRKGPEALGEQRGSSLPSVCPLRLHLLRPVPCSGILRTEIIGCVPLQGLPSLRSLDPARSSGSLFLAAPITWPGAVSCPYCGATRPPPSLGSRKTGPPHTCSVPVHKGRSLARGCGSSPWCVSWCPVNTQSQPLSGRTASPLTSDGSSAFPLQDFTCPCSALSLLPAPALSG